MNKSERNGGRKEKRGKQVLLAQSNIWRQDSSSTVIGKKAAAFLKTGKMVIIRACRQRKLVGVVIKVVVGCLSTRAHKPLAPAEKVCVAVRASCESKRSQGDCG